jgi:HK97 gp10 family phage protein
MARTTVRVEGLVELDNALSELPKATARNVLRRALLKAGEPIRAAAEVNAPERTGTLKTRIAIGTKLTRRQKKMHKRESAVEVFVGPSGVLSYAVPQEFGTAHHGPHAYMRPAWDENKTEALEIIKKDLGAEIEKARARLARKAARQMKG